MSIIRSWTWDDNQERSEQEMDDIRPTLNALASEWSQINTEIENEGFSADARREDGYDDRDEPECPNCDRGYLEDRRTPQQVYCRRCHETNPQVVWVRITCHVCHGSGIDHAAIAEMQKRERQRNANRQVRIEIIEEMLGRYGARMMRPYEHWNEDERYMEYMENRHE